jgi:peptidoglycan L-alanyl-D-glutamate endopeptidase CwlK
MAQDNLTIERIKKAHPKLRDELEQLYLECNNTVLGKGVRLRFSHVLRTLEEQEELFAKGRTKPGKKVTNAKPGQSYHNYGLAFDIVLLYDNVETAHLKKLLGICLEMGQRQKSRLERSSQFL